MNRKIGVRLVKCLVAGAALAVFFAAGCGVGQQCVCGVDQAGSIGIIAAASEQAFTGNGYAE